MNRTGYGPPKTSSPGVRDIYFIFQTNGASNPATTAFSGAKSFIASVTHTGGGQNYVLTLADPLVQVLYADAMLIDTAGASLTCSAITGEAGTTGPVVTFLCWAANGAASNDYTAGKKVLVKLTVKESTVSG